MMKNPVGYILNAAFGSKVDVVTLPQAGESQDLRFQFFEDWPDGRTILVWQTDCSDVEIVGNFEHIKKIVSVVSGPVKGKVWVRAYDENGFYWDSPRVIFASYELTGEA